MIITLVIVVFVLFVLVLGMGWYIKRITDQLELLDKEQHTQNNEITALMKNHTQYQRMLLQHSEVLLYLAERDETLKKYTMGYSSIIGEA